MLICLMGGGGGGPHPVLAGEGGYLIQSLGGGTQSSPGWGGGGVTPSSPGWGGGIPSSHGWGGGGGGGQYPHPVLVRGGITHPFLAGGGRVPYPVLAGRYPIQSWPEGGTPSSPGRGGVHHPVMARGVPHPVLTGGYPPIQTCDGVSPQSAGWGTPHPDLGWGTPLPCQLDGITPPPLKVEQTHTCENITSRRTTYAGGNNVQNGILPELLTLSLMVLANSSHSLFLLPMFLSNSSNCSKVSM